MAATISTQPHTGTLIIPDPTSALNSSPHDDGWYCKLEIAKRDELEGLMDAAAYEALLSESD